MITLSDGTVIFKPNKAPKSLEGYEQDPFEVGVFRPIYLNCAHRELRKTIRIPCNLAPGRTKEVVRDYCSLFERAIDRGHCRKCSSRASGDGPQGE